LFGYHTRPFQHGFKWFADAHQILLHDFGNWLRLSLIVVGLFLVATAVPMGSLVLQIAMPALWYGIYVAGKASHSGEQWSVQILFSGFSQDKRKLLVLGAILAGINLVILSIAFMVLENVVDVQPIVTAMLNQNPQALEKILADPILVEKILMVVLLVLTVSLPVVMAGWFAPILVIEKGLSVIESLRVSFNICLRNTAPFLLFGLVGFVLIMFVVMTLFVAAIYAVPLFFVSFFTSFDDIWPAATPGNDEPQVKITL